MGVVLAPANGRGVARRLIESGARELYLGFYDPAWEESFGAAPLNRMSGFGAEANAFSFEELLDEVSAVREEADKEGLPHIYCVFNSMGYTARQHSYIARRYLEPLAAAGVTGVILSGPELAHTAKRCGLETVASTMAAAYNVDAVRWLGEHDIDRVILPRDLTLDDIAAIVCAEPAMRYEVFLMRNGCVFADSHCMGLHRSGMPSVCRTIRSSQTWHQGSAFVPDEDPTARGLTQGLWSERFHLNACGLCALWRFEQLGIEAYKVVGRGDGASDLAADVALVARNLALAAASPTEADYLATMERPAGILALCENEGLSCYYPEVRFGA